MLPTETDRTPVSPTNDTHPDAEERQIEAYRRMTPGEKLALVFRLTDAVDRLALADIRRRHPNADAHEQKMRLGSRWIDAETMLRVFGWDVAKEGY